jgi:hypothetical protein
VSVVATRPTRELVPIGQYPARCIDVYDAGFWPGLEAGHVHKVKVVFYLGQDSKTGRHLYIELFERLSLGEKANLTKYLTSWRGKPFTAEELKGFDLERLVNAPALIQVAHKRSAMAATATTSPPSWDCRRDSRRPPHRPTTSGTRTAGAVRFALSRSLREVSIEHRPHRKRR